MVPVEIQTQSVEMKTGEKQGANRRPNQALRIILVIDENVGIPMLCGGTKKIVCKISKDGTPLAII